MHRRRFIALIASGAACLAAPVLAAEPKKSPDAKAAKPAETPEAVVTAFYKKGDLGSFYLKKPIRERTFTPELADLIGKALAKGEKNDEPAIDYDPLIDGQDGETKNLSIVETSRSADRAVVEAKFLSFDEKLTVTFDFESVKGRWLVADIRGREDNSLKKICRDYLAAPASEAPAD